ncbi:BTAD domain-containing putative transcriptional regulator [Catellatospora sp. NPDC049609]|uniref:AfsR/SARP family transcriptional regulator n=1 Tax=Catellatospora sp. NPDC049609 TaxID=3155505 RepID=UPI00343A0B2B
MTDVRIQVLGPAGAWRGGHPVDIGPAGQRALFGLLALHCGQVLRRDDLAAGLWPDRPAPPSAANVIQSYVLRLRRLLEPDRPARTPSAVLRKVGDGYRLCLPSAAVDLLRFREHVTAAVDHQQRGRLDDAAASLAEALRQWQGEPLADIPVLAEHPRVVALAAERQEALARYGELAVAVGRSADGLPALEEAASAQPLNEAWHARLILAYQAAGRRGQAFAAYHDIRRRLAEELGVDPGAELAAAHDVLLHTEHRPPRPAAAVPAQLPADVHAFTGRADELAALDRLPGAVAAVVISGAPGVGKTSLAVHWAHRIASRFPDGQLYLNLRGFDPAGVSMTPADAVRRVLDGLGVSAERMPDDTDAQAALYRSMVAGRRMLIVLDNARDAAHVGPLLPGTPGCLLLVTSRYQLAGLVATGGAHPLPLAPLDLADAHRLLSRRIGATRLAAEPTAVADMLDRCAGLPLALVILAAQAALNRQLPLAAVADQLRGDGERLDALTTGEPETDLRSVFSWSYHALPAPTARLFRMLGLHPGPEITVPAAASLTDWPVAEVRRQLAELVRAGLASTPVPGRYLLHDLIRSYAAEVAAQVEPAADLRAAVLRLLDHLLRTAHTAEQLTQPRPDDRLAAPPAPGADLAELADAEQALAWLDAERAVLVAAVEQAVTVSAGRAWRLARTVSTYLDRRGHWEDLARVQRLAVAAARHDGAPGAQAVAHRSLARACIRLRRMDEALAELRQAGGLYREFGDLTGQSRVELDLSLMQERQGRYRQALDHAQRGLAIMRGAADRHGVARARNAVGWCRALLGDHAAALEHCTAALAELAELGDRSGMASTLDSIGYAHYHLGAHDRAVGAYGQALDMYRELGDSHLEGLVLSHLGDALAAAGDGAAARSVWQQALDRLGHLDPPEAALVRARLSGADGGTVR